MEFDFTFLCLKHGQPSKNEVQISPRVVSQTHSFNLNFIGMKQFPVAFITHEWHQQTTSLMDVFLAPYIREYRTINNQLFRLETTCGSVDEIKSYIRDRLDFRYTDTIERPNEKESIISSIQSYLDTFVFVDESEVWREANEPIYVVEPDNSRYGQSGVTLGIREYDNLPSQDMFNALQKEEAQIRYEDIAKNWGAFIGPSPHIEVLMPEMVKCDPQAELVVEELSN